MKTGLPYRFPPTEPFDHPAILTELIGAHRYLAELKGVARTIPNEGILISTLSLQEAQSSSAIENIITTQDALYHYRMDRSTDDAATKEVAHYAEALEEGFHAVRKKGSLTLRTILDIQRILEGNDAGFRKTPGTVLKNLESGEVIYVPPSPEHVPELMSELESYINAESTIDPLIRMALVHHCFESIHPFYDGNGRTGRIINILFLVKEELLLSPILYLSRYINRTRGDYYRLLQGVRDDQGWHDWIIYMLRGVAVTARENIRLVEAIGELFQRTKQTIRERYKFYSHDLINSLLRHPYTKGAVLQQELGISRATAARYLDTLADDGIVEKWKLGKENFYINRELVDLLVEPSVRDV